MVNPMYPIILGEMGKTLKLTRRALESDIKNIAEYWETCLKRAQVENRDAAICILTACVDCYLRGKGIRLGSQKALNANRGVLISLVTLIPLYAWKQPEKHYPKIRELIPLDLPGESQRHGRLDILAEAEKILRNHNK